MASQTEPVTEVLDSNIFEPPATIMEVQDMETQTTIVESDAASNATSSVTTSEFSDYSPIRQNVTSAATIPSPIRQNHSQNRKRPWRKKYGRHVTFSPDVVNISHADLYSIRMNPDKFAKIFGPSVGGVHTAYIKVCIFNVSLTIQLMTIRCF